MILFRKYPSLQRLLQQFWAALSCSDREQQLGVSGSTRRWPENTKERWGSSRPFRDESVGYSSVIEHLYTLIRIHLWYVKNHVLFFQMDKTFPRRTCSVTTPTRCIFTPLLQTTMRKRTERTASPSRAHQSPVLGSLLQNCFWQKWKLLSR